MDCDSIYIGQTRRSIATRLQEHNAAVRTGRSEKSSVVEHAVERNHRIDMENVSKIKTVTQPYKLDAWKSLFITNPTPPLMNKDDQPITSSLFCLADLEVIC